MIEITKKSRLVVMACDMTGALTGSYRDASPADLADAGYAPSGEVEAAFTDADHYRSLWDDARPRLEVAVERAERAEDAIAGYEADLPKYGKRIEELTNALSVHRAFVAAFDVWERGRSLPESADRLDAMLAARARCAETARSCETCGYRHGHETDAPCNHCPSPELPHWEPIAPQPCGECERIEACRRVIGLCATELEEDLTETHPLDAPHLVERAFIVAHDREKELRAERDNAKEDLDTANAAIAAVHKQLAERGEECKRLRSTAYSLAYAIVPKEEFRGESESATWEAAIGQADILHRTIATVVAKNTAMRAVCEAAQKWAAAFGPISAHNNPTVNNLLQAVRALGEVPRG